MNKDEALAQARQVLVEEERKRVEACRKDMQAVLEKHGCTLQVSMLLLPGQFPVPQVQIVPAQGGRDDGELA